MKIFLSQFTGAYKGGTVSEGKRVFTLKILCGETEKKPFTKGCLCSEWSGCLKANGMRWGDGSQNPRCHSGTATQAFARCFLSGRALQECLEVS